MMRNLLDKLEPNFHKGGKWEKFYALFEACLLYTSDAADE